MKKFSTLQIASGPVFNCDDLLKPKLLALSSFSRGVFVSLAKESSISVFGDYKVVLVGRVGGYGLLSNIKLFLVSLKEARAVKVENGLDLVLTYDPLLTGLMGCCIKLFFRCKFISEVNGVYDSNELYKFRGGWVLKIKKYFYPKIQKMVLGYADAIKCLYKGQIDSFRISPKIRLFNFFDFTNIKLGKYFVNEKPLLLTIGFPVYIKGTDLLIQVFNKLHSDYPDWKLKIVGFYSPAESAMLSRLSGDNNMIEVAPPVAFDAIPGLIDSCDIFVLPSRTEAMGRVLIEAMARGRSRIASRVDGIPTVVDDGIDGLLFEKENLAELESQLRKLMASDMVRQELSEAGLLRFKRDFTVDIYSEHVKSMFHKVCGS